MLNTERQNQFHQRRSLILGERLHRIFRLIPETAKRLVDVGCDHGRLGVFALEEAKVERVLACDLREQPLARAKGLFTRRKLLNRVTFCLTNGLTDVVLQQDDCVVIAGMGGLEIASILKNRTVDQTAVCNTYILHPTRSAEDLRQTLYELHFEIISENLCCEEDKIYPIFLVQQVLSIERDAQPQDIALFFGPCLWQHYLQLQDKLAKTAMSALTLTQDETLLLEYYTRRLKSLAKMSQDPRKRQYCQDLMQVMHGKR